MGKIVDWIEAHPETIGMMLFAVPFILAMKNLVTVRETLEDRDSWPTLVADYNRKGSEAYFETIQNFLGIVEKY